MSQFKKLGRKTASRNRLMRNLATGLVLYERIHTTEAKAKALVPVAERLITMARRGDIAARRYAKSLLFDDNAVAKLFEDMSERWGTRTSGFVRVTKVAPRAGDGAAMALVELLVTPLEEVVAKKESKEKPEPSAKDEKSPAKKSKKAEKNEEKTV